MINVIKEIVIRDGKGFFYNKSYMQIFESNKKDYYDDEEWHFLHATNNLLVIRKYMNEEIEENSIASKEWVERGSLLAWNPENPEGGDWFIGCIHDTEDGPCCYWLKKV